MVQVLPENPSVRLLKHIIRCYMRLSDNARAREALRQCLPPLLMDPGFTSCLKDDIQTRGCACLLTSTDRSSRLACHQQMGTKFSSLAISRVCLESLRVSYRCIWTLMHYANRLSSLEDFQRLPESGSCICKCLLCWTVRHVARDEAHLLDRLSLRMC